MLCGWGDQKYEEADLQSDDGVIVPGDGGKGRLRRLGGAVVGSQGQPQRLRHRVRIIRPGAGGHPGTIGPGVGLGRARGGLHTL